MDPVRNLDAEIARLQKEKARLATEAAASVSPSATDEQWIGWQGAVVARAAGRTLFASGAMMHGDRRVETYEQRGRSLAQRLEDLRKTAATELAQSEADFRRLKAALAGGGSQHPVAARSGFLWDEAVTSRYGARPEEKTDCYGRPSGAGALKRIREFVLRQRQELADVDRALFDLPEAKQRRASDLFAQQAAAEQAAVPNEALSVSI